MIREFFLKFYLKRKVKAKNLKEDLTFPQIFQKAGNLLVCLPNKLEQAIFSLQYLEFLEEIFSPVQIYLLSSFADLEKLLPEKSIFHFIHLPEKSKKFFFPPPRSFLKKLKEHNFHITLDFDLSKNILNSYLCWASASPLRIGLKRGWGNPYYNLEVALPKGKPEELYQLFIETLKKLVKN